MTKKESIKISFELDTSKITKQIGIILKCLDELIALEKTRESSSS